MVSLRQARVGLASVRTTSVFDTTSMSIELYIMCYV